MKFIKKFLELYLVKCGNFENFPMFPFEKPNNSNLTNFQSLVLNDDEFKIMTLGRDEFYLYEKYDFINDSNGDSYSESIALENKDWIFQIKEFSQYQPLTLLKEETNYLLDNLEDLHNYCISLSFSNDYKSYVINKHFVQGDEWIEYKNPGLLLQAYKTLSCAVEPLSYRSSNSIELLVYQNEPSDLNITNKEYVSHETIQILNTYFNFFALCFRKTLMENKYFEKTSEEKFNFLKKFIEPVFESDFSNNYVKQNKSDFKLTFIISLLLYFPEFMEDINSTKMIENLTKYMGDINTFINYYSNYESSLWGNFDIYQDSYYSLTYIYTKNYKDFLNWQVLNVQIPEYSQIISQFTKTLDSKKYLYYHEKNKIFTYNNNFLYVGDDSIDSSIDNFKNLISAIYDKKIPFLDINTLKIIDDINAPFSILEKYKNESFPIVLVSNLLTQIFEIQSFNNYQVDKKLYDIKTLYDFIIDSFYQFDHETQNYIFEVFKIIPIQYNNNNDNDNDNIKFFNISQEVILEINNLLPEKSLKILTYLREQEMLISIPQKNIGSKPKKF